MLLLASLVLGFATFDTLSGFVVVWLHPTPIRPCLDVTTWDASPWCWLLCAYHSPFPLLATCHACLCHLLTFYASLHACLHVHAWVLLACVSSMFQYNEVVDVRSKHTFIPRGHHLLLPSYLFAFSLVSLFSCFLAYLPFSSLVFLSCCLSCLLPHAMLTSLVRLFALYPLRIIRASLSFHCLSVGSCLCLCMYTHRARTHGARAQSPKRKQKRAWIQACG